VPETSEPDRPVPAAPPPPPPLDLDSVDLDPSQTSDDTDASWGDVPSSGSAVDDLRRYLEEKPPHHVD